MVEDKSTNRTGIDDELLKKASKKLQHDSTIAFGGKDDLTFVTYCGIPKYIAPEVYIRMESQGYNNRVDSWSVFLIALFTYDLSTGIADWLAFKPHEPARTINDRVYSLSKQACALADSDRDFPLAELECPAPSSPEVEDLPDDQNPHSFPVNGFTGTSTLRA
ncbi:hypothetical protein C8F04DRAFT_1398889 [Mycena alexandri]|uniref:Protein kinase domain-containing protein n=1 Tax=Mycena alexandri TaxID=1745969 RepID=A0AAD6X196_9AGAR|nr:hypothetical protein C8F04DRAFT_1398889 [Mycena alexandri]